MALGIISIKATASTILSTRPTSIKITGTGDAPISKLEIYDANDIPISTLLNIVSGTEYEIMTGVESEALRPEYFVPAPVVRLDFTTNLDATPLLSVTDIGFGTRTTNSDGKLAIKEVQDDRLTGAGAGITITGGGTARAYTTDADAMASWIGGTIENTTTLTMEILKGMGDWYPAFGINHKEKRIDYGIVNTSFGKQLRGETV
jgi:hypothetical protein